MDRRAFLGTALRTSWAAGLGLAALPIASALRLWPGRAHGQEGDAEKEPAYYRLTEDEVIELTLNYADSYAEVLPGVDIRASLLDRLLKDRR